MIGLLVGASAFSIGHITLGQTFFDGTKTTPGGKDSFGGVLLHELSHHICDTADEERPMMVAMRASLGVRCVGLSALHAMAYSYIAGKVLVAVPTGRNFICIQEFTDAAPSPALQCRRRR